MSNVDRRLTWRHHAACAHAEATIFFPEDGLDALEARQVCAGCPVRLACLEYALETDQRFGVWGGTRPIHRSRLRAHHIEEER